MAIYPGSFFSTFRFFAVVAIVLGAALGLGYVWSVWGPGETIHRWSTMGNGRIEATEIDIATKLPGRVANVLVDEGDLVEKGKVAARMDTEVLEAELREALAKALYARETKAVAAAEVTQRDSECAYAQKTFDRTLELFKKSHAAEDRLDRARSTLEVAEAACVAAEAKVTEAGAAIAAAEARVERLQAELEDAELKAPRAGQILYRLAEPGEVLPAGGKVLTLIDLDDITMTVFLPTKEVGRIQIGAEARIVLDAVPERPVPAIVSFIASKAQFTPRQVETAEEREKLMFRVKVRAIENPDRLLKPGMPGVAYIQQIDAGPWPDWLQPSGN